MLKKSMNFTILFIYILLMITITAFQLLSVSIYPEILDDDALFTTFSSITNLALYLSLFFIFLILFKEYFIEQFNYLIKHWRKIFLIIVLGFSSMLAAAAASTTIMEYFGVTETSENQEALNMLMEGSLFDKISLFIFAVMLAPLVEELVFRKAIFGIFDFKNPYEKGKLKYIVHKVLVSGIAIFISSLVFGLIHVTTGDFVQIIYYSGLGVILGVFYIIGNKNIYVPIIVHFLINLMVTLLMIFEF